MSFLTIKPEQECSVAQVFHNKATPIVYRKYSISSEEQDQRSQSNMAYYFSCMFDSRSLASSTLVGRDLQPADIKHGTQSSYRKSAAVNCYAFACGRAPNDNGDDPVPGAYFLEYKIRAEIKTCLKLTRSSHTEKNPSILDRNMDAVKPFLEKIDENRDMKDLVENINAFSKAFFNQPFKDLDNNKKNCFSSSLQKISKSHLSL